MPEVAIIRDNIEVNYEELTLGDLVDLRYNLEQQRKEVAATERTIKQQIADIDHQLFDYHENNPGVSEIRGTRAKVKWSEETHYNTEAGRKEEIRDWLFQNGHQYLMTWHLNRAATEAYVSMHGELPGVTPFVKQKVSCTKV